MAKEAEDSGTVWLVTNFASFQGDALRGIYTTHEAAEARAAEVISTTQDVEVFEVRLNEPIDIWMGG